MKQVLLLAAVSTFAIAKAFKKLRHHAVKALDDLSRSEALAAEITQSALDCIISIDHEGRIVEFNPAAEKTFGYKRAEVIGKEMASLVIPPVLREQHRKGLARYLETGEGPILNRRIELPAIRSDGSEFVIELTVARVKTRKGPVFTAFLRDITERRRIESQLLQAIRARDELVAVVSHELKNPLSTLATSLELISRTKDTDKKREMLGKALERMGASVDRMKRLTSDLLDITRIEAGKFSLEQAPQDAVAIIDESVDSLQSQAFEKRIKLEKLVPSSMPQVQCDKERVIQVLVNLIGNAIKFSPEESSVSIRASAKDHEVRFEVEDHGAGIADEQQAKVFDRFWQAKQTAFKGAGLGLPIAKGIIEAHGGAMGLQSKVGVGSTFFFTLKKAVSKEAPLAAAS